MLHLSADDLSSALEGIQPIDVLVGELTVRTARDRTKEQDATGRLTPWPGSGTGTGASTRDLLLLEDHRGGAICALPASSLRGCHGAVLTRLAARQLLNPGAATAAVLGSGAAADLQLVTIARHLRSVRHIWLCPMAADRGRPIGRRALDQIDLAGIHLTVASATREGVAAANLVVVTGDAPTRLEIGHLSAGAVVVNAMNRDLPDGLVDAADQLFVDDADLVEHHAERYFARVHLATQLAERERSWLPNGWGTRRRIDADLSQVLAGEHPGRTHLDHIVLVELLSANLLDVALSRLLYRAAIERGLGNQWLD